MRHTSLRFACATRWFGVVISLCAPSFAQPDRIAGQIDDDQRFTLRAHVHRLANSLYDQGRAEESLRIERLTLVLKPSDAQAAELNRLLGELQYSKSSNYHKWLTPESYADRFGVSHSDIAKIIEWLMAQQLTLSSVSRARNAIMVSGRVERVEHAFQTEIHTYAVAGETHYANATNPSVPSALEGVVLAIHGLHDFRLRPKSRMVRTLLATEGGAAPNYTRNSSGKQSLTPDDYGAIFESIKPPSTDSPPHNIVIVGQSQVDPSRLNRFRSYFGLGDAQLTTMLVPNTRDPGTRTSDAQHSDLDLEWASAVAPRARLQFVYSYDVIDAVQYAVDENLAPILGMSYGECETSSSTSDAQTMRTWARQANAQGITWVAASGDSGAAGCYHGRSAEQD
jgi:subtilase family serine protease